MVSRNRQSSLQAIAGRGTAASQWDNTPGSWVLGISATLIDNVYGYLVRRGARDTCHNPGVGCRFGVNWCPYRHHFCTTCALSFVTCASLLQGIKVVTNDGQVAGGSSRNVIRSLAESYQVLGFQSTAIGAADNATAANQSALYMPRVLPPVTSGGPSTRYFIQGCQDPACTSLTYANWDSAPNNTFNGSVSVVWNMTTNTPYPAINRNNVFRLGGVPGTTGNAIYSFEGDSESRVEAKPAPLAAAISSTMWLSLYSPVCLPARSYARVVLPGVPSAVAALCCVCSLRVPDLPRVPRHRQARPRQRLAAVARRG